jgi:hypothetical protein
VELKSSLLQLNSSPSTDASYQQSLEVLACGLVATVPFRCPPRFSRPALTQRPSLPSTTGTLGDVSRDVGDEFLAGWIQVMPFFLSFFAWTLTMLGFRVGWSFLQYFVNERHVGGRCQGRGGDDGE